LNNFTQRKVCKFERKEASGLPVILGMDDNVPEAEQEYIDKVLSKITKNSTKAASVKQLTAFALLYFINQIIFK